MMFPKQLPKITHPLIWKFILAILLQFVKGQSLMIPLQPKPELWPFQILLYHTITSPIANVLLCQVIRHRNKCLDCKTDRHLICSALMVKQYKTRHLRDNNEGTKRQYTRNVSLLQLIGRVCWSQSANMEFGNSK